MFISANTKLRITSTQLELYKTYIKYPCLSVPIINCYRLKVSGNEKTDIYYFINADCANISMHNKRYYKQFK